MQRARMRAAVAVPSGGAAARSGVGSQELIALPDLSSMAWLPGKGAGAHRMDEDGVAKETRREEGGRGGMGRGGGGRTTVHLRPTRHQSGFKKMRL